MKTLKINKLILILISLLVFNGCVQDDEFSTPNTSIVEPNLTGDVVQISAIAGELAQAQGNTSLNYTDEDTTYSYTFNEDDLFVEGYVVSTDEGGNFFEEIIIQDNIENPTLGVKVLIDVNPLFIRYDFGRKVYIKLNGLSVGITNGVLTLGALAGSEVDKIPSASENDFIFRSAEQADIVPLPMTISEFTNAKTNLFIQLQDVQFNRNEATGDNPFTYASEPFDEFDGERTLESCTGSSTAVFSTSTFADFKGLTLPSGRGSMNAVLTKNFFGDTFNVVINTPEDINFDNEDRCDPIILSCGLATSVGGTNLFEDDFESQSPFSLISGNGWTNFIEEGTEGWEAYTQTGSNSSQGVSARVGSFQSGDASSVAWLITPQIDLDANSNVTLQFETSNSFSDGSTMQVLFSKDWDGTPTGVTSATWGVVNDAYVTQDDDSFSSWFDSGIVDLSCETGQIYIAFKYVGSGNSDFDGTYELDFVSIDAN